MLEVLGFTSRIVNKGLICKLVILRERNYVSYFSLEKKRITFWETFLEYEPKQEQIFYFLFTPSIRIYSQYPLLFCRNITAIPGGKRKSIHLP